MKTNVSACSSIGSYFYPQIGKIYLDMLTMYRASSQLIDEAVQSGGTFCFLAWCSMNTAYKSRKHCHENAQSPRSEDDQEGNPQAYQRLR